MGTSKAVAAPSTAGFALFGGGGYDARTAAIQKYDYTTKVVTSAGTLSLARGILAGAGNYTVGLFCAGNYGNNLETKAVDKYTYSTNSVAAGTALDANGGGDTTSGAANQTVAVVTGSYLNSGASHVYTFASDTTFAGTQMTNSLQYPAAAGTGTFFISGGSYSGLRNTNKYTYASHTCINSTLLFMAQSVLGAAGNAIKSVWGGGMPKATTTCTYTYDSSTVTQGTALGLDRAGVTAAGNAFQGIFSGGNTSASPNGVTGTTGYTDTYTYDNSTVLAGSALLIPKQYMGACSSTPGGF